MGKIQLDNATSNLPQSLQHLLDYRLQMILFIPFTGIFALHPHGCLMFELSVPELFTRNCLTHFKYVFIQSLHSLCFVRHMSLKSIFSPLLYVLYNIYKSLKPSSKGLSFPKKTTLVQVVLGFFSSSSPPISGFQAKTLPFSGSNLPPALQSCPEGGTKARTQQS